MASTQAHLRAIFRAGTFAGLPDGVVLERFVDGPAEVAQAAFAALVERHGPAVRRVCREVTRDHHDAEDAAQATFLVLARSARSLRSKDSVAAWLRGVALRVSARANADDARRRARERRAGGREPVIPRTGVHHEVHEEIARLPERYRLPIVLCHLEGLSHAQAAGRLGCPVRTIQTRLSRGRDRLRSALERRGVGPAAGALVPSMVAEADSVAWASATVRLAMHWGIKRGVAAPGMVPGAATLAEEVVRIMIIQNLKFAAGVTLIAVATLAGARISTGSREAQRDAQSEPGVPGAVIKGRVTGPDGRPLAGAELSSPFVKLRGDRAKTGPDGRFTLTAEEAPLGEFPLRVDAPGRPSKMFTIEAPQGPPSTPTIGLTVPGQGAHLMGPMGEIGDDLVMQRGSVVTGRVVREGRPVSGVTVGLLRDAVRFDGLMAPEEVRTDLDGRFRFPQAPADSRGWVYVPTGSLERGGAVGPTPLATPAPGASLDLGDVEVRRGRTVSGRVILADGKPLPAAGEVLASTEHAGGVLKAALDPSGRFTLAGLPDGQAMISLYFPDARSYAPAGYRVSEKNRCRDPLNPWMLVGRVDRDVANLTILFERGETPPPSTDPGVLDTFKKARSGAIAGALPGPDE